MKKVLIFVPTFSNLSETFILRELDALDKNQRIEVAVLTLKQGKAEIPQNLRNKIFYIPLNFGVGISALPFIFKNLFFISKIGLDFFKTSNDSFLRNIKNFIKSIFFAYRLSFFNFDQLHIHFLSDISTILGLASLIVKKPFSISGHARDIFVDGSAINFKVQKAKFITLCNTKAFLKCLELSGGKGRKNVVLGFHGIDPREYEFKMRELNFTKQIEILTDARFTPKKGLIPLSQAIISLINDYDFKINFTIIGLAIGEEQENLMKEVKEIFKNAKVYDSLHIPGNGSGIQQAEVMKYYQQADVFIYAGINTSGGDADGVPNGLLQAAFSGLPVLTTNAGSIGDLYNNENSYIIEQNSSESIIEKFNEMVLDKQLNQKVQKLLHQVSENFEVSKNIKYLEDLLIK